ncbi:Uncharacterized protein KIAA0930 homolog [Eumeta japonica]|uniref:Uncharacterized protein KIAA0930 homolog n=1 Tax=Eumeta variegata TaxID=151549 RepID=A0A4C1WS96_EUMVA|nr:Uncharacterized protein KIAA0930 homolog [Eumeta japonica]
MNSSRRREPLPIPDAPPDGDASAVGTLLLVKFSPELASSIHHCTLVQASALPTRRDTARGYRLEYVALFVSTFQVSLSVFSVSATSGMALCAPVSIDMPYRELLLRHVFCDIVARDGEMVCVELVARGRGGAAQAVIFLGSIRYDALSRVYDSRRLLAIDTSATVIHQLANDGNTDSDRYQLCRAIGTRVMGGKPSPPGMYVLQYIAPRDLPPPRPEAGGPRHGVRGIGYAGAADRIAIAGVPTRAAGGGAPRAPHARLGLMYGRRQVYGRLR